MVHEQDTVTGERRDARRFRIVHVMRAPVGGLFRHVVDLAREQAARGHMVGIIADSATGDERASAILESLKLSLALGVKRLKMSRLPSWRDPVVAFEAASLLDELAPDVVHGHGAKGGLFARLPALAPGHPSARRRAIRVYTPHGGSLHFDPRSLAARLYMSIEKALEGATDLIFFESEYIKRRFIAHVGLNHAVSLVVPNGIAPREFEPATPAPGAADFFYVGELRRFKGVDTLIDALAIIRARTGEALRLVLVGSGPDEAFLRALAARNGVSDHLSFVASMPVADAFRLGRTIVVPSRAESLPYIVLEAIGARVPIVAANVGGIPEIFGPEVDRLVESDNPAKLARAMIAIHHMDENERRRLSDRMAAYVGARFRLDGMADAVLRGYGDAFRVAETRHRDVLPALPRQFEREGRTQ